VSDHGVADDGGGGWLGREVDLDAVAGEHLRSGGGEVLGGEAGIVADDQAAAGGPGLLEVIGDALGAVADVLEGELLPDDGPPAVRAELDGVLFN
jgi:hypothetical protein